VTSQPLQALNRPGWLTFVAVVMFSVGILRVISAIYYFADSARVNDLSGGAFGRHLWVWGVWDLLIAFLALWGGWSLLDGKTFGRVVGYLWAAVVLIQGFMILRYSPWFGFGSIILAVLVIYALAVTGGWEGDGSASV
jgi:hypothetical protein